MPKKWIWIGIAALLVVALTVTGLLLFFLGDNGLQDPDVGLQQEGQAETKRYGIVACQTVGAWARDRWSDSKIGPDKSFDEFIGTYWNPQAPGNYKGEPGIIYLLDGYYDLTELTAYFANREYFFKLYVSSDCQEFTQVFEVNADNMAQVFDKDYCCRITGLDAKNVAFIKMVFTGSNSTDNNAYISLRHIKYGGTWLKEGPSEIPIEREQAEKKKSIIANHLITGAWIRDREGDSAIGPKVSYDGNEYTIWNPQASGKYQGRPAIVYMLDGYYDLTSLQIVTDKREYYMQVYTSSDGLEFDLLADITAANYTEYYDGLICMLKDLTCKDVGYIRIEFTGSNSIDNNTYLSLAEVLPTGTKLNKPAPTEIPDTEPKVGNTLIAAHRVSGSWIRDREDMESLSAKKAYDENAYSYWNPQANGGYQGKPGIVFMLNGYYDVDEIQLIFGSREYYFELYTSTDGYRFDRVVTVNAGNMSSYYDGLTVHRKGVNAKNVGYVKIVFTGSHSKDNNTYVSLMEVVVRGTKLDKEGPKTIPDTDEKVEATKIAKHMIVGSWIRDREDTDSLAPYRAYDSNLYSGWNPQANSGYTGKPSVIYMLKGYYDISEFKLTFDKRAYFFELYTSADGTNFNLAVKVTKENMSSYYKGYVFSVKDLNIQGVGYVKLVFTGSDSHDNNTYISLMEVGITGKRRSGNGPSSIPAQPQENQAKTTIIADHKIVGSWIRDREDTPSLAPKNTYDENLYSAWNPQTQSGYSGNPGIIYRLKGFYDISEIKLTFDKREYFFEIYTSQDGITYTELAKVTVDSYADYYQELVCTFKDLDVKNVGYMKLVFTGSNSGDNNTFISLMEAEIEGIRQGSDEPGAIPEEPETPVDPDDDNAVQIIFNEVVGSWANDRVGTTLGPDRTYDGNLTTNWNPAVTGYTSEAAIVYTLNKYYDLEKIVLTFGSRQHYITVSASTDGQNYTEIATVNSGNADQYYTDLICTLDNLTVQYVKYIKVDFIGTANGTTWINMMEIQAYGTEATEAPEPGETEPEATEPEATEPEVTEPEQAQASIIANKVVGSWANDRVGTTIGPERTYDGNVTTNWNPAVTGFNSEVAIVYTLDKSYDVTKLELTFGSRHHYITVSVSADGEYYTEIATVNSGNAEQYYTDLVCTLSDLTATNVKYVKVSFTGTSNGTTWINMMEIRAFGKETVSDPEDPEVTGPDVTEPEVTEPETTEPEITEPEKVAAKIVGNEVIGSWANDRVGTTIGPERTYDGSLTTNWNPAVSGFNSEAAIVYTLDKSYDLSQIILTFGSRHHYITVSVSTDGESFTEITTVNSGNAEQYYTDLVCTFQNLTAKNVKHIKVSFIGTANGTTWINLMEIQACGVAVDVEEEPEITEPDGEDTRPEVTAAIAGYEVVGTWIRDREGDSKIGPQMSFDANASSIWNPQATNYQSGEGIIYTLNKAYDLEKIALTFGTRQYYFTLHVSSDGESYTQVAEVNSGSAASYYTELVCTVEALNQENIQYIKILFTGSANSTTYISLADVEITGRERIVE